MFFGGESKIHATYQVNVFFGGESKVINIQ